LLWEPEEVLPVPVRVTVSRLLTELSVKVSVPETEPVAVGVKVTPTEQVAPAAMLAPQVLEARLKPAVVAIPLKLTAALLWLVTVTDLAALVVLTLTEPKLSELAERVSGAVPVPLRLTVCGVLRASSLKVSVPAETAMAVGEKVTPTEQEPLAARLAPQVPLATLKPAEAVMPEKFRATLSRLVRVTDLAALVLPTTTEPKPRELDEKVTGAEPVPVRATVCVPALSLMVIEPETVPTVIAVKLTEMVQVPAGAMLPVQVLVWLNDVEARTLPTISGPLPVLVRVTVLAVLVAPRTVDEKLSEVGETEATGAVAMPVRAMAWLGPALPESSVTIRFPLAGPAANGAKETLAMQVEAGASTP